MRTAPATSRNLHLDDETLSLFAQVDYDLTDRLTLTAGVNYTSLRNRPGCGGQ